MADAFIYYRLQSNNTNKEYAGMSNPSSVPSGQKLIFTLPDELLESVGMTYENNIKDTPVSNPDGTRRITKQDNGLMGISFVFRGRFKDVSTDITKLIDFSKLKQVESTGFTNSLEYGIFGFFTDNTNIRPFNYDPTKTGGLTIRSFNMSRVGSMPKSFDFTVNMSFGGNF